MNSQKTKLPPLSSDRSFGLLLTLILLLLALRPLLRSTSPASVHLPLIYFSGITLTLSILFPRALNAANQAWSQLSRLLQKIVNPIVMMVLFFVVVTPIAFIYRRLSQPFTKKTIQSTSSFWIYRDPKENISASMTHPF